MSLAGAGWSWAGLGLLCSWAGACGGGAVGCGAWILGLVAGAGAGAV